MKKILFLLLFTIASYGQAVFDEGIQITNTESATATKVNVQEANGKVNTQTIKTGFNKNFGLNTGDVVGANTLLNQYSTTPIDWTATAFNSGQVVFYGGKQWIAKIATVAGDVPAVSSKWDEITFEALANKTTTVDQTIIDGSTNAVSGNAVFDGLVLKAPISSVHNPVTLGTANGLSLSNQQISLGLASSGVTGALSGADWNTFNDKQNTITGLTTNFLPKWNGSGFGNSTIFDNGTNVGIGIQSTVAKFHVGDRNVSRSSNARVLVSETFNNSTSGNGHAFSDSSLITQSPFTAYASYDARVELKSSGILADHYVSYQAAPKLNFTGSLSSLWGIYTTAEINSGTIANNYGLYVANPVKTGGTLNNNTGLYIENQTSGAQNYSIFSEGGKNALLGTLSVGDTNPTGGGVFSVFSDSGDHIRIKRASQTDRAIVISGSDLLSIGTWVNPSQFTLDVNGNAQFVGTISASPATTANQVPTWGQVQAAARPYKVYTALLTQTGTNAPTATVLENTLGGTVVWSRSIAGEYYGTLTGAFTLGKTYATIVNGSSIDGIPLYYQTARISSDVVRIISIKGTSQTDSLINGMSCELRVYN